nr:sulfurtransferase [Burkholderiales bacterium]
MTMAYSRLVSTDVLAERLGDPRWIVCDCRHDLLDPAAGRRAYVAGHLPGAHFLDLGQDLSGARTGQNGRHPLPDAQLLVAKLSRLGVGNDSQVIAYDARDGAFAARLWWLLRWLGHEAVAVLDGGMAKWTAEGKPVTAQLPAAKLASFERRPGALPVDATFVLTHLDGAGMQLIDARAPDRFAGRNETLDPVAGHIPGALNRFYQTNLDQQGCFKPPHALQQEFKLLLDGKRPREVVHQCGSGVTACHNLLAMEHAGLTGSRLYPGSWSEWCADAGRPVAKE